MPTFQVEFEEVESARQCVKVSQENPVEVAGVPALFNYSTSQTIQRGSLESDKPNHVLALTISNATYPINARVIHRVRFVKWKANYKPIFRHALLLAESSELQS